MQKLKSVLITLVILSSGLNYLPSVHAESYWWTGVLYFNSLSELCEAEASASSQQLCDISSIIDCPQYGGECGSCRIVNDCDELGGWKSYFTKELYALVTPIDSTQPNMCTGNPVDPVTGNKFQQEQLIEIDAVHPIKFSLFYNSNRLEKWRHSYSRSLAFGSFPSGPRLEMNGVALGIDPTVMPESPSSLGGDISGLGVKYNAPDSTLMDYYGTEQAACVGGWLAQKPYRHFPWIDNSVAELRQTPISSFAAVNQCYILDGPGGQVKLILDIYDVIAGVPSGYGDLPGDSFLRFTRENGSVIVFSNFDVIENRSKSGETLEIIGAGTTATYRLHTAKDEIEEYSSTGKLVSITSAQGHVQSMLYDPATGLLEQVVNQTGESLNFVYEPYGSTNQYKRISTITDHDNRTWTFNYDAVNYNLKSIDNPDFTFREYHYDDTRDKQLLTGITDENGQRYATWTYDEEKRATLSAHDTDQSIDRVELTYLSNGQRTVKTIRTTGFNVQDPPIVEIESNFSTHIGGNSPIVAEITGHNPIKFEHDAMTGYLEYIEDKGLRTEYSNYDDRGNPGTVTEAAGTGLQRETSYTYDTRYHSKVATMTEPSVSFDSSANKVTTYLYDDFANNTEITIDGFKFDTTPVSRTTTFQYNGPFHQLSQIDGPRTDVSDIYTISYYADNASEGHNRARMKAVFAPLNITLYSNITYTATGKIQSYLDANNVQATLLYYPGNDRLHTLELHDLNTGEKRLTVWDYLATGEVETITTGFDLADKTTLTLVYDTARRLRGIVDGLGNEVEYILDSEGNVEQENIRDNGGVLKKQLTQTFDAYNRLQLRTQVNENFTETWLPNGTLDKTVDGKNVTTEYDYDELRRLKTINQDDGGSNTQTANALTRLNYNVHDELTSAINPVDGETIYSYDDLGNLLNRISPDTGTTIYGHDDAGNITSMQDENDNNISYSYDALNRLTSITTGNAEDDYQFEYDNCQNGTGRLCKVINANSTQHYRYDAFGNVISQQSIGNAYDTANRLETITYPSGAIVHYDYDLAGQVMQVSLEKNGTLTPLALNVAYEPFGDVTNLLYGNGLTLSQSKDKAYRPISQSILSVFELNYVDYDANGNLEQRDDAVSATSSFFGYDEHNRLTTAAGDFGVRNYGYDKNANRASDTTNGMVTSYGYEPATNRLSMRGVDGASLDGNGNTLAIGDRGYSHTKHNRLFEVFDNGVLKATYQYNGLGQRISKILPDGSGKYFIYDTDGQLMAETDINGNILFEYIYLNDQLLAKYTPDTDIDGTSNYEEDKLGTNPAEPDLDGDGLTDLDEMFFYGTSVSSNDTDGDGIGDSEELAFNSNPNDSNINYGDINLNGEFNLGDYVVLMQFIVGTRTPNPTEQEQADINQDGELDIKDALLMQRVLLGLQLSWFNHPAESIESFFANLYQQVIPPAYAANGDGEIYYVHNDHLGTPVKMTNELGFVVWHAVHDPFGKATVDEDVDGDGKSVEMNVRFPGQYYDAESGLHYNYFRTYDPALGRYITSDPIGLLGGKNTYFYANNNPIKFIDETGKISVIGGFVGGGVEIGLQLALNGGDINSIDWTDVGVSTAVGAAGPGLIDTFRKLNRLSKILNTTKNKMRNRRARQMFGDIAFTQIGWQTINIFGKGFINTIQDDYSNDTKICGD